MKYKFLVVAIITMLVLSSCSTNDITSSSSEDSADKNLSATESVESVEAVPEPRATMPTAISKTVSGVTVSVDPMIEMLSVIQYLSDYDETFGLLTDHKTTYHDDLEESFREFESHEAVVYFNSVMTDGFAFDSPPKACLFLDENFAIRQEFEGSDYHRNQLQNVPIEEGIVPFRDVMEQFYIDTNFGEFYEAHTAFYNRMINTYAEKFPEWNMINAMESYYSKEMAGYNIVLVALFHQGGFGPSLELSDGMHVYSVQGPYLAEDDTPLFGDGDAIANLVIHEFGHSFVAVNELDNPAMAAEVERSEYLMEAVYDDMNESAYGSWAIAYEELVLRAAVIDIMKENTEVNPEDLLKYEREVGFIYIDIAYETVLQYSSSRDKYPMFDDFIPVITDALLAAYPNETATS